MIFEPSGPYLAGRRRVAAVENQRPAHGIVHALPIEGAEFIPLGCNQQRCIAKFRDVRPIGNKFFSNRS